MEKELLLIGKVSLPALGPGNSQLGGMSATIARPAQAVNPALLVGDAAICFLYRQVYVIDKDGLNSQL
jgi:hypothetical protein